MANITFVRPLHRYGLRSSPNPRSLLSAVGPFFSPKNVRKSRRAKRAGSCGPSLIWLSRDDVKVHLCHGFLQIFAHDANVKMLWMPCQHAIRSAAFLSVVRTDFH